MLSHNLLCTSATFWHFVLPFIFLDIDLPSNLLLLLTWTRSLNHFWIDHNWLLRSLTNGYNYCTTIWESESYLQLKDKKIRYMYIQQLENLSYRKLMTNSSFCLCNNWLSMITHIYVFTTHIGYSFWHPIEILS